MSRSPSRHGAHARQASYSQANNPPQSPSHRIPNQPINQSINQSINQPVNQPINHAANQPHIQSINQPISQPSIQPNNQQVDAPIAQTVNVNQPTNQPGNQPTNQSVNPPISQSVNQLVSQSVSQPINQPVNQPINQPVSQVGTPRSRQVTPEPRRSSLNHSNNSSIIRPINQTSPVRVSFSDEDNQSISQSSGQSVSQSINQSVSQSINQSVSQPVRRIHRSASNELSCQSISRSPLIDRSLVDDRFINQSQNRPSNQSVVDMYNPTMIQPHSSEHESINQSINQPVIQSLNSPLSDHESHSIDQLVDSLLAHAQPADHSASLTTNQSIDQASGRTSIQSIGQSIVDLAVQTSSCPSINQSITQRIHQSPSVDSPRKSALKSSFPSTSQTTSQTNSRQASVQFSDQLFEQINQPTPTSSQPISHSTNTTNQPVNQSIDSSFDPSSSVEPGEAAPSQMNNQQINQSINPTIRSLYEPSTPSNQSINQSTHKSTSQLMTPPLTPHHIALDMPNAVSPYQQTHSLSNRSTNQSINSGDPSNIIPVNQSINQSSNISPNQSNRVSPRTSLNLSINTSKEIINQGTMPSVDSSTHQSFDQSINRMEKPLTIDPSSSPVNPFTPSHTPAVRSTNPPRRSDSQSTIQSLIDANQSMNPTSHPTNSQSRNLAVIQSVDDDFDDSPNDEKPGKTFNPRNYLSPTNQSVNESINQQMNAAINQQIMNQALKQPLSPSINAMPAIARGTVSPVPTPNQSNQPVSPPISQSANRSTNPSIDHMNEPINSPAEVTLADLIDQAGPSNDYINHLIDPLPKSRNVAGKASSRTNQSTLQSNNKNPNAPMERSAAAVVFNNQSPQAGQNPLQSLTNAANIMSKMRSNNSSNQLRRRFNSQGQSTNQSNASDTETNQSINQPVTRCCARMMEGCRSAYDYMFSFDPWLVGIVFICTIAAVLLYVFNCRDVLGWGRNCVDWMWGNPLYMWFAMVAMLVACYQVSTIAETLVLLLFSETSGTRFWRVWLYGSAIEWSGRHLAYFSALLACRQQNVFKLESNVSSIVDPLLGIFVMALSLQIVKKMILKHIVWKMNQKAFDAKIEQLFFVVDFISLISDKANMLPSEQIAPNRTNRSASVSRSSAGGHQTPNETVNPRIPASHQKHYGDLLNSVKNWTLGQTQAREILRNTKLAHEAGKALWRNVDVGRRGYVTLMDFQCWLPLDKACRAFYLCLPPIKRAQVNASSGLHEDEEDENHSDSALFPRAAIPYSALSLPPSELMPFFLTKQEFIAAIVQFATDRRKLALELTDWSNMSDILNSIGTIIWVFCCIFIFIAMYSSFSTASLTPLTSFVLAWAFMFGNSAKMLLEAIVFILVSKPFSLGDRIYVPSHSSSDLIVHNIALLTTTFKDALTNKLVAIPNSILNAQELQNLTRSKQPCFEIPMELDLDVTAEQLASLQQSITHWMLNGDQKGSWIDRVALNMTKDALWLKEGKVKMVLRVSHSKSWNEVAKLQTSLKALIQHVSQLTKELDVRPKK